LDPFLADGGLSMNVYSDSMLKTVKYQDKIWGLPWSAEIPVLFCNWTLFEKAGIAEPPKTWQEFADAITKLAKDTNGDGQIDQWGLNITRMTVTSLPVQLWATLTFQRGGNWLDAQGFHFDSKEARESAAFVKSLVNNPGVGTAKELDDTAVAAMSITTADNLIEMAKKQRPECKYRVAPIPTDGGKVFFDTRRLYLLIRKSTPEKEAASWEFLKWVSRKDIPITAADTFVPCRKDVAEIAGFKEVLEAHYIDAQAIPQMSDWVLDPAPELAGRVPAYTVIGAQFAAMCKGESYDSTLVAFEKDLSNLLTPVTATELNLDSLFK
jgi:multiple sugar transport system substrate-binding protein